MIDFLQIILLIFIAGFIITRSNERSIAGLFSKPRRIILDSCALIDGRIVEITNSRFVADELVIPQFILNELQMLADGSDSHKRERARFGFDIAHQLQDTAPNQVTIERSVFPEAKAIDDKLVLLARKLKAQLYTTDYNLAKVAAVEGVQVLNVNELAQSLRPVTLPGETLTIKIIQRGSGRDQGVGYLDDGTMIVVDGAARYVNKAVPVTVTRMHQTVAGKMVFGQVRTPEPSAPTSRNAISGKGGETPSAGVRSVQAALAGKAKTSAAPAARTDAKSDTTSYGKLHGRLKTLGRRRPIQ